MPPFQSNSSTANVSTSPQYLVDLLMFELGKKIDDSQMFTQDSLLTLSDWVDKLNKGKGVSHAYSTKDPNSLVAPTSTTEVEYGMPPNYFAQQTPPPCTVRPYRAEPVQPAASASQTGSSTAGAVRPIQHTSKTDAMVLASVTRPPLMPILSSATLGRIDGLVDFVPLNHMANHLSHQHYNKMFGMI